MDGRGSYEFAIGGNVKVVDNQFAERCQVSHDSQWPSRAVTMAIWLSICVDIQMSGRIFSESQRGAPRKSSSGRRDARCKEAL